MTTSANLSLHQIKLEIGQQNQTVTASAEAIAVETQTAAVTGQVTPTQLDTVPNQTRNYLGTLQVLPGVVGSPFSGGAPTIQGGRSGQALVQLDGVADTDNVLTAE